MKKKIYFTGSIRGGRDFADLYRKMIEHMQMTDIELVDVGPVLFVDKK